MHSAILRIECERPEAVKASLLPDVEEAHDSHTEIVAGDEFVEITITAEKLGRVKALFNTYSSLASMLIQADEELLGNEGKDA